MRKLTCTTPCYKNIDPSPDDHANGITRAENEWKEWKHRCAQQCRPQRSRQWGNEEHGEEYAPEIFRVRDDLLIC